MLASGIGSFSASPQTHAMAPSSICLARRTPSFSISALISQTVMSASPPGRAPAARCETRCRPCRRPRRARLAGLRIEPFDHRVFPQPMDAARHQVVHHVVAARHRRKDLAHEAFLLGLGHFAEAEAGSGVSSWAHNSLRRRPLAMVSIAQLQSLPTPDRHARIARSRNREDGPQPVAGGPRFTKVETRRGDLRVPFPPDFAERLTAARSSGSGGAPNICWPNSTAAKRWSIHLGMSGRMSVYAEGKEPQARHYVYDQAPADAGHGKHDHVVMETDAPARIVFTDHRRFGLMTLIDTDKLERGQAVQRHRHRAAVGWLRRRLSRPRAEGEEARRSNPRCSTSASSRARQYLCLRGALPRRHLAQALSRDHSRQAFDAARRTRSRSVLQEAIKAGGSILARLRPRRWRARRIPASLRRLRPRRRTLPGPRLQRHDQAHRAGGTFDVLLSELSEVISAEPAPPCPPAQAFLSR